MKNVGMNVALLLSGAHLIAIGVTGHSTGARVLRLTDALLNDSTGH